jgi:hypothetical protein
MHVLAMLGWILYWILSQVTHLSAVSTHVAQLAIHTLQV